MTRAERLDQLHLDASVLTIGSFDGVHRGHQALVREMVLDARQLGVPAVVLTFFPHPSVVLRGRRPTFYIMTPDEKATALADLGVDVVITQPFDLALAHIAAADFLALLRLHLGFRSLWIGEDFALGHRREGNRLFLEQAARRDGFELHAVPPFRMGGEPVSSTRVREALRSGDVARAASYLGRPFALPGKVVRGAGRGRRLGFPTANLDFWDERAYPGVGVYACWVLAGGKRLAAVTNIGLRPTFDEDKPTVETFILDFQGEVYGQELRIELVHRLRGEVRFPTPEALREQIEKDVAATRTYLA